MNISDKHITEQNVKDFTEEILPNLSQNEWKSLA